MLHSAACCEVTSLYFLGRSSLCSWTLASLTFARRRSCVTISDALSVTPVALLACLYELSRFLNRANHAVASDNRHRKFSHARARLLSSAFLDMWTAFMVGRRRNSAFSDNAFAGLRSRAFVALGLRNCWDPSTNYGGDCRPFWSPRARTDARLVSMLWISITCFFCGENWQLADNRLFQESSSSSMVFLW